MKFAQIEKRGMSSLIEVVVKAELQGSIYIVEKATRALIVKKRRGWARYYSSHAKASSLYGV